MSAFNSTILGLINPVVDHRDQVQIPIMGKVERMRFVKLAVQDISGAHQSFNRIFGGTKKANDYPLPRLIDAGVPAFLWCH